MAEKHSIFKLSPEAKVGLFVLIGIILLVYMSLRVGGIQFGRAEGYTLYVKFDSAAGLDKDASVRVAGVEVGRVTDIMLKENKAQLTLKVRPEIKIGSDFTALLVTKGLLGERYVELLPGSPNAPLLGDGDEITRAASYADMDKLITILSDVSRDIKTVTLTMRNVFGGPEGESALRNIVSNIEEISYRVSALVDKNDAALTNVITNLDEFTTLLREEGPGIRRVVANLNESIVKTSEKINGIMDENRENLREGVESLRLASLKLEEAMKTVNRVVQDVGPTLTDTVASVGSIAGKIDRGEGTIGKLVNDDETHENINKAVSGINRFIEKTESFHTYIGYRAEYLFDASDTKSYFTLRVQPKSDKYYLFEIVDDPRGNRQEDTVSTTTGGVTTTTTEIRTKDEFQFSIQLAKQFGPFTLRGGLIESTGGVAVDTHLFKNRLKFTLEAFDFDKSDNPHLKATGTIYFSRFFYLTGGYDDFVSRVGLDSGFVGLGLEIRDDDLKYLFSAAPPISF